MNKVVLGCLGGLIHIFLLLNVHHSFTSGYTKRWWWLCKVSKENEWTNKRTDSWCVWYTPACRFTQHYQYQQEQTAITSITVMIKQELIVSQRRRRRVASDRERNHCEEKIHHRRNDVCAAVFSDRNFNLNPSLQIPPQTRADWIRDAKGIRKIVWER